MSRGIGMLCRNLLLYSMMCMGMPELVPESVGLTVNMRLTDVKKLIRIFGETLSY